MRAKSHQACLQNTQDLVKICQELGWRVNLGKSELESKQVRSGRFRPTADRWQSLQDKILELLSLPAWQLITLIGLLTTTEKQVHLDRLSYETHTVASPKQLEGTRVTRKGVSNTKVLAPTPTVVAARGQCPYRLTITPNKHALQIFTDTSAEGWGAHLNERTARGTWSLPESKLHINYLELKAVFLAIKEFQDLCLHKLVLVATDNTTVVSYINKEGDMRSGPLCALLWGILTWCTRNQVTLKARHIPGQLDVVADKLSRLGQTIQSGLSFRRFSKQYAACGTGLN